MTPLGLIQLKNDEGLELTAYPDPITKGDPWTIGYGCTGPGITKDTVWTEEKANGEILKRVKQIEIQLSNRLSWFSKLNPVRQDVLVNISYNIGVAGLMKWPITLSSIGRGEYTEAAQDIGGNKKWFNQVHDRVTRCARAMKTGTWN